jgi:tRNA(Ile)-lysidine synthase TilS/MesJ
MLRDITIKTASEEIAVKTDDSLTLEEVLRTKRIPPNLFQGYTKVGEEIHPIPLNTYIFIIPSEEKIVLHCIRNTDLRDVLPQKTTYNKIQNPVVAIPEFNFGDDGCSQIIHELNPDSAKELVKGKIVDFVKKNSRADTSIVGISGGGDSNTLAQGLKALTLENPNKRFVFFTIIFEPIWVVSAAERASELCLTHGLTHHVYGDKEIENLLGMKKSLNSFYKEYCERFGDNTSHFFGTYLISLVARELCKKNHTNEYILGFNREDLLSDLLFSLMNGQKPLAFPIRDFGSTRLLMPLWDISKIILDACYPKYSLLNYQERQDDQSTYQRNIIYYLAHSVEDIYPNLGLSLMEGVQKIFAGQWAKLYSEDGLDIFPSEYADSIKLEEVKNFLKKYF